MNTFLGSRILVTGGAGFVGANLIHRLVTDGAAVHALIRPSSKLWRIERLLKSITLHTADLTDSPGVQKAMQSANPDFIFDIAAERSEINDRSLIQRHVAATLNLLAAAASMKFVRFVRTGSSMEYGKKGKELAENDLLDPDHPFSIGKAASTMIYRDFARSENLPITIMRLFSVYGPWEAAHRLIATAMVASIQGDELKLTEHGFRRDFIFVDDVVDALLRAATTDLPPGEVLNVCTGVQTSNEDAVELVQQVVGRRIRINVGRYPARHTDTSFWIGDPSKTAALLKWKAADDLRSGLEKTAVWFRNHLSLYRE